MEKKSSIFKVVMSRVWSLLLFFIVLIVLSFISSNLKFSFFKNIYELLYSSTLLIIGLNIYFILGGVFMRIKFPFSMASPIFNAPGAVLLTEFIIKIMHFMDNYIVGEVFSFLTPIENNIRFLVYILTIVIGYIIVISEIENKEDLSMKEVKTEFKESFSEFFSKFKKPFKKEDKKPKDKKEK